MREHVLRYLRQRQLLRPGDRVLAAVSGGADSVALARVLLELREELGVVLAVAHFNHLARGQASDADEAFVFDLAKRHELEFHVGRRDVAEYARSEQLSMEAAGRRLRYAWLAQVARDHRFSSVATAHTGDDQAETVLMKFLRGAGTKGLAGIYPVVEAGACRLVRPLLQVSRSEVEAYLTSLDQPWREDETNLDHRFRRNRIRHELLPLLEREYNPNLRQVLREAAEINRAEEDEWAQRTRTVLDGLRVENTRLRLTDFAALSLAMQRRVLKLFREAHLLVADFAHVEKLRRCALGEMQRVELSQDWLACRRGDCLTLEGPGNVAAAESYSYLLPVPGEVAIPEIGCVIQAVPVPAQFAVTAAPGTLLRADLIGPALRVRNWQHGDRYHPAYSGSAEKLKRLFAEKKIPAEQRVSWPVVLKGAEIVWVRDFAVAEGFCRREGDGDAVRVECVPEKTDLGNERRS
jgi:tRNA(Ile)-lysidine synthase